MSRRPFAGNRYHTSSILAISAAEQYFLMFFLYIYKYIRNQFYNDRWLRSPVDFKYMGVTRGYGTVSYVHLFGISCAPLEYIYFRIYQPKRKRINFILFNMFNEGFHTFDLFYFSFNSNTTHQLLFCCLLFLRSFKTVPLELLNFDTSLLRSSNRFPSKPVNLN